MGILTHSRRGEDGSAAPHYGTADHVNQSTSTEPRRLDYLYQRTLDLLRDDARITRALDWVDQVLPQLTAACRTALQESAHRPLERWSAWLDSSDAAVIAEAGKGEIFEWRMHWLRQLIEITSALSERGRSQQQQTAMARAFHARNTVATACFPLGFWIDLVNYLCSGEASPSASRVRSVVFPLVLSEPVVDAGSETNVILAQFLLERSALPPHSTGSPEGTGISGSTRVGQVYIHPEQAVLRGLDSSFASSVANAAQAARAGLPADGRPWPDVRIRIQTVKPSHERFLSGTMLRGESGGGALAVGLQTMYLGQQAPDPARAISFAVNGPAGSAVDGRCYPVAGTDDKIRGCAKHGMEALIVAMEQQRPLTLYGHKNGLRILGSGTVRDAVRFATNSSAVAANENGPNVVILFDRRSEADDSVCQRLEARLAEKGCRVFLDRRPEMDIKWAQEIDRQVQQADIVVPLISRSSINDDMLLALLHAANDARQVGDSKPRISPVRVSYDGPLPERIGYLLSTLPFISWQRPEDEDGVVSFILQSSGAQPAAPEPQTQAYSAGLPRNLSEDLEAYGGLVPLKSRFYIERDADRPFLAAIAQRHSVVLLKGARQIGKSSLLARGLHQAENTGARVALTDFQKLSAEDLATPQSFYVAIARMLARQLKISVALTDTWTPGRSANLNFEEYLEDYVLPETGPFIWAMDEVDKLFFSTTFSNDVFGLFRSWANERQGRPSSPWAALTMAIAYATEAHLFIRDVNQSPFNIGTRFELKDFDRSQMSVLNERYGSPLHTDSEIARFHQFVGGHPYLSRRGLYTIISEEMSVATFESAAPSDSGPMSDHLRRILTLVARNEDNCDALREILRGKPCPSFDAFYHLRSAGLVTGDSTQDAAIRCRLYELYLARHLL